jgi:heme/copper-type cytochrome/quinol oxidase subunit 3
MFCYKHLHNFKCKICLFKFQKIRFKFQSFSKNIINTCLFSNIFHIIKNETFSNIYHENSELQKILIFHYYYSMILLHIQLTREEYCVL